MGKLNAYLQITHRIALRIYEICPRWIQIGVMKKFKWFESGVSFMNNDWGWLRRTLDICAEGREISFASGSLSESELFDLQFRVVISFSIPFASQNPPLITWVNRWIIEFHQSLPTTSHSRHFIISSLTFHLPSPQKEADLGTGLRTNLLLNLQTAVKYIQI